MVECLKCGEEFVFPEYKRVLHFNKVIFIPICPHCGVDLNAVQHPPIEDVVEQT